VGPRTLSEDDEAAICAAYPPGRKIDKDYNTCEPYGGYSSDCYEKKGCGCKVAGLPQGSSQAHWLGALALGALVLRRRRTGSTARG